MRYHVVPWLRVAWHGSVCCGSPVSRLYPDVRHVPESLPGIALFQAFCPVGTLEADGRLRLQNLNCRFGNTFSESGAATPDRSLCSSSLRWLLHASFTAAELCSRDDL